MDKQTGSNSSSQGTSESRDINLGCGPSPASSSAAAATSSSQTTAAGGSVNGGGVASTSKFTSITSHQQHQAIPPPGATISGTIVGPAALLQHSPPPLTLNINTTTGGNFSVIVEASNTVENLRKVIAKKLKVAKDRICLLHREKELQDGTLKDNGLMDGSKIILIPNVETGLLAQRPENTVMQALESLNDSQVNDFLSGKTPLNLSMRLGDHMMLIQLQLSTVNPVNSNGHSSSSSSRTRSSQRSSRSSLSSTGSSSTQSGHNHHSHHHHHHHHHTNSQSTSSTTSVASTSVSAPRKLDIDAANTALNAHTSHRQRISSTIPSLRLPPSTGSTIRSSDLSSFLSKRDYESLQNIVRSIAMAKPTKMPPPATTTTVGAQTEPLLATATASRVTTCCSKTIGCVVPSTATPSTGFHAPEEPALLEQSPIKSLSNLVSSPIKTTAIKNIPIASSGGSSSSSSAVVATVTGDSAAVATCQDAISAKLTSCLCTRLNSTSASATSSSSKSCVESTCQSRQEAVETSVTESRAALLTSTPSKSSSSTMIATASPSSSLLHKTANNPIGRSKHRHHHHHHHHHHHYHHHGSGSSSSVGGAGSSLRKMSVSPRSSSVLSTSTNDSGFVSETDATTALAATQQQTTSSTAASPTSVDLDDSGVALTDTRTLAEASRNLTQTLRKLSKEVFTNKIDLSSEETPRKSSSGAVIESMKNHGKGIYSGTFSGTLNPALQDRYGRPKRDISTVIHILNDLLSATPQYSRGARISFEAPSTSSSSAASTSSGHASRSKQHPSKHHHHSYAHSLDSCVKCSKAQNQNSAMNSNSSACAYGECNGHYANTASKQAKQASYACCQDLSAAASSHHHQITDANNSNDRNTCNCRYGIQSETGERELEQMCQKCLVEMENNKTKSKLDQLRLVMQQRKQKREARKLKGAPYGARVVGATTGVTSSDAAAATVTSASTGGVGSTASSSTTNPLTTQLATASSNEVSPNHIVEEVDTAA